MTNSKHLTPEEEYFAREEISKLKKLADERKKTQIEEEKEKLKQLHWMSCPKCGQELHEVLFRGITIDRCFSCNGVFLDDGELQSLAGNESNFFGSVLSLFKS